jgi:DNA helicase-2/ATP-dependent DNA helicase PcrA
VEEETGDRATLSGFLEEVALVADIDNVDESDDKILLMTLHSAKGLEFPVVYMAGVEDGVFPSYRTITSDDPDDMEEERRLAYVGITRAQEDLHILCAKQRMINGETQYNPVSRFVKEIPSNLMDSRVPTYKKIDLDDYDDDSYERTTFKSKPYGMGGGYTSGQSSYGGNMASAGGRSAFGNMGNTPGTKSYGGSAPSSYATKPKAALKPKVAPVSAQPYIVKPGLNGLTKGVQGAGEKPAYDVGDRVKHIKFGEGTVKAMTKGARDYEVTVEFDGAGPKIMYAAFAKLQKME